MEFLLGTANGKSIYRKEENEDIGSVDHMHKSDLESLKRYLNGSLYSNRKIGRYTLTYLRTYLQCAINS